MKALLKKVHPVAVQGGKAEPGFNKTLGLDNGGKKAE